MKKAAIFGIFSFSQILFNFLSFSNGNFLISPRAFEKKR
jgi:hypothetical protein